MKKYFSIKERQGSILVVALWSLSLLGVFAATLGVGVRQKITLLARLENRQRLNLIAESHIKKAVQILKYNIRENNYLYTPDGKANRHNNQIQFQDLTLERGVTQITYEYFDDEAMSSQLRYGFMDEEGKLNINKAEAAALKNLIKYVLHLGEMEATDLTRAIIDWREPHESELVGFSSDKYYENLEYPYAAKDGDFEVMEELLLVKGINPPILNRLSSFVTIYGDGKVNINTASRAVLLALGLSEELVDKVLFVRRGNDGIEATSDDFVFQKTFDIISDLERFVKLKKDEVDQINTFNSLGRLETNSYYYLIKGKTELFPQRASKTIECVFNVAEEKIEHWKESY